MSVNNGKTDTERLRELEAALAKARARLQEEELESARRKREVEQIYAEMFSRNTAPKLLIHPKTGAIADANPAALDFYGYTLEAIREQRIQDINLLSDAEVAAEREKALSEERRYFEFRHRLANGEIRNVEVYSGPVLIGGTNYLQSIIHDVTERRRLEQERAQIQEILEATPDLVGMVDLQ
ncbi:MAG: PAS domain S-box protein, partial [Marinobacter sp.]|nr:PAS domain S-box protein [Marinobacter sp.]